MPPNERPKRPFLTAAQRQQRQDDMARDVYGPYEQPQRYWTKELQSLVDWFSDAQAKGILATEPFNLKKGVRVFEPARYYEFLAVEIQLREKGPRVVSGALREELARLQRITAAWQKKLEERGIAPEPEVEALPAEPVKKPAAKRKAAKPKPTPEIEASAPEPAVETGESFKETVKRKNAEIERARGKPPSGLF